MVERDTPQTASSGPTFLAQWEPMWNCLDSQEVGVEAAPLERVRHSSLVEWFRADNVTGLKPRAEAADRRVSGGGRGASCRQ
jgi:hypothetical protein